jgi:hypothetical protein
MPETLIKVLLGALCATLGLVRPAADESGVYALDLPDGLRLRLSETRAGITLSGIVRALPGDAGEAEALCRELLKLSLGRAKRECADSLPRLGLRAGNIVLEDMIEPESTMREQEKQTERFLNLLEKWTSLAAAGETRRPYPQAMRPGVLMP